MQYLIHAANVIYLASYFCRDALRLRIFAIIAALCLIPYLYYRPQPLIGAVCWNAFFALLNGVWVARLWFERRRRRVVNAGFEAEVISRVQTATFTVTRMGAGLELEPALSHLSHGSNAARPQ